MGENKRRCFLCKWRVKEKSRRGNEMLVNESNVNLCFCSFISQNRDVHCFCLHVLLVIFIQIQVISKNLTYYFLKLEIAEFEARVIRSAVTPLLNYLLLELL